MKKFLLLLFFACGIFLLLSQGEVLWSKLNFLDAPRVHKVQKGESLSKLAKQYYGDAQRWRELAIVNRAPKPNHLEVGEEILLPSATVINELRRSRTITRVNALVGEQEKIAVRATPESPQTLRQSGEPTAVPVETPAASSGQSTNLVPETSPEVMAPPAEPITESSGFPWFWLAIALIIIAGAAAFLWYRRKHAEDKKIEIEIVEPRHSFEDRSARPSFSYSSKDSRDPFDRTEREKESLAV
ncbi:MAG: LysM peptidoglycan-binding domain-containing protein [candidate division KSB1 bacterium]|nr:LysM peptidoglycan-binding domain-containing protein [candidate division KSB1 bacterium]MDZ7303174.1 LysM peptidoglycan-binding domain-containing protein [candidate division KSB1 bacterium]MDZ7310153.1 LysM peptidoglycan-binding domain-containing protein [candidate division KSB1 bacterium]